MAMPWFLVIILGVAILALWEFTELGHLISDLSRGRKAISETSLKSDAFRFEKHNFSNSIVRHLFLRIS